MTESVQVIDPREGALRGCDLLDVCENVGGWKKQSEQQANRG